MHTSRCWSWVSNVNYFCKRCAPRIFREWVEQVTSRFQFGPCKQRMVDYVNWRLGKYWTSSLLHYHFRPRYFRKCYTIYADKPEMEYFPVPLEFTKNKFHYFLILYVNYTKSTYSNSTKFYSPNDNILDKKKLFYKKRRINYKEKL